MSAMPSPEPLARPRRPAPESLPRARAAPTLLLLGLVGLCLAACAPVSPAGAGSEPTPHGEPSRPTPAATPTAEAGLRGFAPRPERPAPDAALRLAGEEGLGEAWRPSDERGRALALFFGYTSCPDVCPQTLNVLRLALLALGDRADEVRVAFVTVDPERDDPERLAAYAGTFHPAIRGLSGSPEEILRAAEAWGVQYEREPSADGDPERYTMAHSGTVFLVDPQGQVRSEHRGVLVPEDVAHDLGLLLDEAR